MTNNYRFLFAFGYLISQKAYKEHIASEYIPKFEEVIKSLKKEKCHFHEISRWLECLILIDGFNNVLEDSLDLHINQILESFNFFKDDYEKKNNELVANNNELIQQLNTLNVLHYESKENLALQISTLNQEIKSLGIELKDCTNNNLIEIARLGNLIDLRDTRTISTYVF